MTPTEFLCIDGEDRWYILHYSSRLQRYQATDKSILPIQNPFIGYWHLDEPDHPDYVIPAQQPEPVEEYLAGGLHHTITLEGPQSQLSPTHLILSVIEQAAVQGEEIPVDIQPIASTSQVIITPTPMAQPAQANIQIVQPQIPAQQQQAQGQQQQVPAQVAVANGNGTLKGNPPVHFTGERSKSCRFLNAFNLYKETNCNNETIKNPYSCVTTALTYMTGDMMESWKEDQLQQLIDRIAGGTPDTDEHHWQLFKAEFHTAFTNTNAIKDTQRELRSLKQGESLDEYITKFKQLAHLGNLPFTEHGVIEQFKPGLKGGLLDAIICTDYYDPQVAWTFK